jgi:hypothetical protein
MVGQGTQNTAVITGVVIVIFIVAAAAFVAKLKRKRTK